MAKRPGEKQARILEGDVVAWGDVTACSICWRNYGWMQWMADGINDSIVTDHQKNPWEQLIIIVPSIVGALSFFIFGGDDQVIFL